ncbi:MAG: hypothetical protein EOO17_04455 [Chloroflexi bacterium]|nr:MAG: hypothetical protein EOO17_04455 [Chloroflexota bacterium]
MSRFNKRVTADAGQEGSKALSSQISSMGLNPDVYRVQRQTKNYGGSLRAVSGGGRRASKKS